MTEIEECLQMRENFYAFLYRMYLEEPPRKLAEDLVNKNVPIPKSVSLNDEVADGFDLLKEYMNKCTDVDDVCEKLRDEYTRLFLGPPVAIIPPYESVYGAETRDGTPERMNILLKVKEAYRRAGIIKSKEYKEPEDHIAFELRFMHYLCEEALKAIGDGARVRNCLTLQKEFMDEHLRQWVPKFCDDLYDNKRSDFYKGIAKIAKGFLLLDSELIDELLEGL
ncbi:MAG: molecular chaperone TorD family protein [Methanosarcinales archaeon]|nr:MAG: molecular chaperone TorD family protein [Methanosarcinales archaeon]